MCQWSFILTKDTEQFTIPHLLQRTGDSRSKCLTEAVCGSLPDCLVNHRCGSNNSLSGVFSGRRICASCLMLASSTPESPEGAQVSWLWCWLLAPDFPQLAMRWLVGQEAEGVSRSSWMAQWGLIRQGLAVRSCCCYCYRTVLHGGDAEA